MSGSQREVTLRFLAGPDNVNLFGKVHGGAVMKWIDEAGFACASGWCGQYCVTVYVGGVQFHQPILIGSIVEVHARLIYTGRTSMHIAVDVCSSDPRVQQYAQTTSCVIVFVAIDGDGRPVPVPAWEPLTDEDRALHEYARRHMELRNEIQAQLAGLEARVKDAQGG